jgi:hypothetical protein
MLRPFCHIIHPSRHCSGAEKRPGQSLYYTPETVKSTGKWSFDAHEILFGSVNPEKGPVIIIVWDQLLVTNVY